jgi:nuclear transport factor 2 (NTF2) superfamily protein
MKEQDVTSVETYPDDDWWRNRIGATVLVGRYADRQSAVREGAREARVRGLDHVVTFTGSRRLRALRDDRTLGPSR